MLCPVEVFIKSKTQVSNIVSTMDLMLFHKVCRGYTQILALPEILVGWFFSKQTFWMCVHLVCMLNMQKLYGV